MHATCSLESKLMVLRTAGNVQGLLRSSGANAHKSTLPVDERIGFALPVNVGEPIVFRVEMEVAIGGDH